MLISMKVLTTAEAVWVLRRSYPNMVSVYPWADNVFLSTHETNTKGIALPRSHPNSPE